LKAARFPTVPSSRYFSVAGPSERLASAYGNEAFLQIEERGGRFTVRVDLPLEPARPDTKE